MYNFRKLVCSYDIESVICFPDGRKSEYNSRMEVQVSYNYVYNDYDFEFQREYVLLNGKPPEKLVDQLMYNIGQSLYPMQLKISREGSIKGVINYEKILQRWNDVCKQILKERGVYMERYILLQKAYMQRVDTLINALKRDNFIQFYFPDKKENILSAVDYNFPVLGKDTYYDLLLSKDNLFYNMEEYLYEDENKYGRVNYEYSSLNDMLSMGGRFTRIVNFEKYEKHIYIIANREKRKASKSNRVLSMFID